MDVDEGVAKSVRDTWLQTMDGFVALHRTGQEYYDAIVTWETFGDRLHVDEDVFRRDVAAKRSMEMEGLRGCSWQRCPLYQCDEAPPGREMERCAQCKTVSVAPPVLPL